VKTEIISIDVFCLEFNVKNKTILDFHVKCKIPEYMKNILRKCKICSILPRNTNIQETKEFWKNKRTQRNNNK